MWHPGQQAGHVASTPAPKRPLVSSLLPVHSHCVGYTQVRSHGCGKRLTRMKAYLGLPRRHRPTCWVRHGQEFEVPGLKSGSGDASHPWKIIPPTGDRVFKHMSPWGTFYTQTSGPRGCLIGPHRARLGSLCDFMFLSLTPMPAPSAPPVHQFRLTACQSAS